MSEEKNHKNHIFNFSNSLKFGIEAGGMIAVLHSYLAISNNPKNIQLSDLLIEDAKILGYGVVSGIIVWYLHNKMVNHVKYCADLVNYNLSLGKLGIEQSYQKIKNGLFSEILTKNYKYPDNQ